MQISKAAKRYAKSLLELAVEKGLLEEVYADVQLVQNTVDETHDLSVLMGSQVIPESKKVVAYTSIFQGKVQELTMSFMALITKGGRSQILEMILESFVDQYKLHKRICIIEVTSAVALSAEMKKQIIAKLKNDHWDTYELNEVVDPTLIGGIILRLNHLQLDQSISTKLRTLKNDIDNNQLIAQS